jgi:hypothetical protein
LVVVWYICEEDGAPKLGKEQNKKKWISSETKNHKFETRIQDGSLRTSSDLPKESTIAL